MSTLSDQPRLIYDISLDGHRLDYTRYLFEYIQAHPALKQHLHFCLPPETQEQLSELLDGLTIHYLPADLVASTVGTPPLQKSLIEWPYLRDVLLTKHLYTHITFLNIDRFQYIVGSAAFRRTNIQSSGIFFQPYPRVWTQMGNVLNSGKAVLKKQRKALQLRWFLRNKHLDKIFILNDQSTIDKLNALANRETLLFHYLPDPIAEHSYASTESIFERYDLEAGRKIFLLFGTMNAKKNALNIIQSLAEVDEKWHSKITLLILGKANDAYAQQIEQLKLKVLQQHPNLQITFGNHFVYQEERDTAFDQADVILMPYINFYSSSNVLGHAAKFEKPVIAANTGLMEEIVNKNNLGITLNPHDTRAIAQSIESYLEDEATLQTSGQHFVQQHNSTAFAKTLLDVKSHI